ncbi:MAG TPA: CDGSH iron-sulfur domain-containing protein [Mariprofundaceae bacterium]|nr:CDGSH iron-sulfur domain-containing protein [Mariprofundaceae bacterium]
MTDAKRPKGKIAAIGPAVLTLEPGEYWWCACGRSQNQPFCDDSHIGTEFMPVQLLLKEKTEVALCRCKQTGTPPFCDGSHKKLKQD